MSNFSSIANNFYSIALSNKIYINVNNNNPVSKSQKSNLQSITTFIENVIIPEFKKGNIEEEEFQKIKKGYIKIVVQIEKKFTTFDKVYRFFHNFVFYWIGLGFTASIEKAKKLIQQPLYTPKQLVDLAIAKQITLSRSANYPKDYFADIEKSYFEGYSNIYVPQVTTDGSRTEFKVSIKDDLKKLLYSDTLEKGKNHDLARLQLIHDLVGNEDHWNLALQPLFTQFPYNFLVGDISGQILTKQEKCLSGQVYYLPQYHMPSNALQLNVLRDSENKIEKIEVICSGDLDLCRPDKSIYRSQVISCQSSFTIRLVNAQESYTNSNGNSYIVDKKPVYENLLFKYISNI